MASKSSSAAGARHLQALAAAFVIALPLTSEAGVVVVNNRVIRTDVDSPYAPSHPGECEEFRKTIHETREEVHKAHEACLANNRGRSFTESSLPALSSGGRRLERCSVPACQELHTARDDLAHSASAGYSKCMADVRSRQAARRSSYGPGGDEDFGSALRRAVKDGTTSAIRSVVKQALNQMIDDVFGEHSRYVKGGLKFAETSNELWQRTSGIREDCAATRRGEVARECDKQVFIMIQDLPRIVPPGVRGDPVIRRIQDEMMERHRAIAGFAAQNWQDVEQQMNEITDTPPSRSRRRTGVIENR